MKAKRKSAPRMAAGNALQNDLHAQYTKFPARRQNCHGCGESVRHPGLCSTCSAWHDAINGIEQTRRALRRARP